MAAALGAGLTACWALRQARRARAELAAARRAVAAASTCTVTGLPLRCSWLPEASAALADGSAAEVAFLDLDGFKAVNDHFGHEAGDGVLATVAARVRACLPDELVGRAGGDELVIVARKAISWEPVLGEIRQEVLVGRGQVAVVGASIGVAPVSGASLSTLLAAADSAMYAAKKQGGGVMYAPSAAEKCSSVALAAPRVG